MAAFLRHVAALAIAVNYPDLGMRWGVGNSSIIRRVPEGTCRQGKTLVAYVIDHKTNYSPFSRPRRPRTDTRVGDVGEIVISSTTRNQQHR